MEFNHRVPETERGISQKKTASFVTITSELTQLVPYLILFLIIVQLQLIFDCSTTTLSTSYPHGAYQITCYIDVLRRYSRWFSLMTWKIFQHLIIIRHFMARVKPPNIILQPVVRGIYKIPIN